MPLNFPTGPTSGATYTYGGKTWQWNTYAWDVVSPNFVNTLNGATGNLSITGSANQVTVNTSASQIVVGLPNNLIVGNLTVTGSLLVSGGITTQISEVVLIEDNIIVLNANVTGGSPTENAGIQVSRGASAAVQLLWNETTDKWSFTNDGSQYYDLPVNVVNTVNGATGNIVSIATTGSNVFTGLNTFNAGISAAGGVTFGGDIAVQGGDITTSSATATVFNTTATTLNLGGAATTLTMGGTSGTASIRNATLRLGNTTNTITTNSGTTNYIQISPYGNISLAPNSPFYSGSSTTLVVTNDQLAAGQVQISGGDLYLGTKFVEELDRSPVNIIFEGVTDNTNETTLTVVDPTADRTITFPDASGTVALTNTTVASFNGSTGAVSFAVPLATTGSTGVASFHFEDFTVGATGHVRIKTGINATNIIVLGSGGTGGIGKLPAVDGSALLEVNAAYLNGKTNSQITDGGTF